MGQRWGYSRVSDDELNNQGDYISGEIGKDGKDIVVGKNIDTRRNQQRNDISVNILPPDHPANKATIADLYVALAGDPLTERPGLIKRVAEVEKRLATVEVGLVEIKELVIVRNDNRNKIHLSTNQLLLSLLILFVVVACVVAIVVTALARTGVIDGRVGLALSLLISN